MTRIESTALDILRRSARTMRHRNESTALGTEGAEHGQARDRRSGWCRAAASPRELAAAGHEVVVVSRSGRAPAVDGVRAAALDATDAAALTAVVARRRRPLQLRQPARTTRTGRGSGRRWRRRCCSRRPTPGPAYVIMGNLYGYGAGRRARSRPTSRSRRRAPTGASGCGCGRTRSPRTVPDGCASPRSGRRTSSVRSPARNAHLGDRVIPRILAGKKVRAFGAADQPHSWTYVPDVARTIADARHRRPVVGTGVARADEPGAHPARGVRVDRGRRAGSRCRPSARSRPADPHRRRRGAR